MLHETAILARLKLMTGSADPELRWDETCEGSACALVIFVGPSPGGAKVERREQLNKAVNLAFWNQPYDAPTKEWSPGFRTSFAPMVEALFGVPFAKAARLVGRANMDWVSNPESEDVPARFMWDGRTSVLNMIAMAKPELVIAWDRKTCMVLEIAMHQAGFQLSSVAAAADQFTVRVSNAEKSRYHRGLQAFKARSPAGAEFVVLKTPQHPSRMFDADYARRCGEALREAAQQIVSGERVNVHRI